MKPYLIALLLLSALYTQAQKTNTDTLKQKQLEEVTILRDKIKSLPGAGQYISLRALQQMNQPNVNNVLRTIPGINIRDEEGFGLRPNIGLRGTPVNRSAKITLMEDGMLVAPAPYADPSAYYFPTFARMQGVEVLKGSSQIKYGPYTIGGAVNLLSTSIPKSFNGFAQLSYGSFNTNQQRLWIGDSKKNLDYVMEVNRLASDGFKQIDGGGNSGFDRRDVMGKVRWHTQNDAKIPQALTLKLANCVEKGNETYLGLTYADYQNNPLRRYVGTQQDKLDLNHQHAMLHHSILPAKGLVIHTSIYATKTYRDWARANTFGGKSISSILNNPAANDTAYSIMTGQRDGTIEYQSAARSYYSKGVQLNANYVFGTKSISHKLQAGARLHQDEADRYATRSTYMMSNGKMVLNAVGVMGNQENQLRQANSLSAFLSYDLQYKGFSISPGIRYEKINFNFKNYGTADVARLGTTLKTASNELSILLPGIGMNYALDKDMNFFAGVHKGFSPPGMPSVTSTTQANMESSVNYELGYRLDKNALHIHTTGFLNNYSNILGSDNVSGGGAGTGDLFNAGHAIIQGIEAQLSYDLFSSLGRKSAFKLPLSLSYTYTSAKFQETFVNGGGDWGSGTITRGDYIPFITPHLFSASLSLEHQRFDIMLTSRYTGATRIKPGQDAAIFPSENNGLSTINSIKEFVILDASANCHISNTFTAFVQVNNVTNNKAIVTNLPQGYRPNMPLSATLGLKARL